MTAVDVQKRQLRAKHRAYRASLSPEEHAIRSRVICDRLLKLKPVQDASVVFAYWPAIDRNEIDIRPALLSLHEAGVQIALPVIVEEATEERSPRMIPKRFIGESDLVRNIWVLCEPSEGSRVPIESIDTVIVPGLAADRQGHRLGYGKGFYDAFLNKTQVATILAIYHPCLEEQLPVERHDEPVRTILTETELLHPGAVVT